MYIGMGLNIGKRIPTQTASPWAAWNGSLDGSLATFRTTLPLYTSVTPLSSSKVLVTWEDAGLADTGFACVGTISGTTITWGTAAQFTASTVSVSSVTAMDSTHAIIAYADTGDSNKIKAVALSISGTTITVGGIVAVDNNASGDAVAVTTLSSSKALVVWNNATSKGKAMVLSLSGTTITTNTAFQFNGASAQARNCTVAAISATQALVVYTDSGNSSFGTAQVLDISTTTVTGNTKYVFKSAISSLYSLANITGGTFVVVYKNAGDSSFSTAQVLSVAGTVVSFGSSVRVINYSPLDYGELCVTKGDSQSAYIFYRNVTDNKGKGVIGTVSGTTLTLGTPVTVVNSVSSSIAACYLDDTHTLVTLHDEADDKGKGKVSRAV